jgi:hypothetical protein
MIYQSKILIPNVSKKDGKELIKWWNANTAHYHFLEKAGRLWNVIRQL